MVTFCQKITLGISAWSLLCVLPKECAILIVFQENSNIAASSRKKQCDVYNSKTRLTKLVQIKSSISWNVLSEVRESKYEKNIMTYQIDNRRD